MFVVSKLLSAITQPAFWLLLLWLLSLLLPSRRQRLARRLQWWSLAALALLGVMALPDALVRPLENRYPVPTESQLAQAAGVIVLGGALDRSYPFIWQAHRQVPLDSSAERMSVPVGWMQRYPQLQLVFSGGEGRLLTTGVTEAAMAGQFYAEQGLDMRRVQLENGARTTRENAQRVAALLGERCQQPWLLVTSAWHMPRSMEEFAATGCQITPYPVDFLTGDATPWTEYSLAHGLLRWQTALHEWLGLLAYRVTR
ncbi:MAG: YdcF family protein [Comamonas sp.]